MKRINCLHRLEFTLDIMIVWMVNKKAGIGREYGID